jgi:hypothetical protein
MPVPTALRKLRKRLRSAGSRPAMGSFTKMSLGFASNAYAMPKRMMHAARVGAERLPWVIPEVGLVLDCEVMKQVVVRDFRINAKLLRQVAEDSANLILAGQNIEPVQMNGALFRLLEGCNGAISELFPAPLRPRRPNITLGMVRVRFFSARIPLG